MDPEALKLKPKETTMKSTLKSRFIAAQKKLHAEERKLEAGKPNEYSTAMKRFCEAQREMETARR